MTILLENFLKERRYLKNISTKTENYYRTAWHSYETRIGQHITKENAVAFVIALREANINPTSCNTYVSALNAYFRWLFENKQ